MVAVLETELPLIFLLALSGDAENPRLIEQFFSGIVSSFYGFP